MAFLRIITDRGHDTIIQLQAMVMRAGRAPSNAISLDDSAASREHFEIVRAGLSFIIRDLGSRNGTLVNGERLSSDVVLHPGDEITVGRTHLVFSDDVLQLSADDAEEGPATLMFEAEQLSSTYLATAESRVDERSQRDLIVLNELSRAIMSISEEQALLDLLANRLRESFTVDRCAVVYRSQDDAEGITIRALSSTRSSDARKVRISTTAARSVLEDRMALLITDVASDERYRAQQSILAESITSILCAPLWHEDTVFGLVYLDSQGAEAFDKVQLALLSAVANLAAIKIDNLRLFAESINRARMERELALAAEIQATMLPAEHFEFPGFSAVGFNRPCYEVGGDYFDFMPLNDGCFSVTVADVSGKGASAALLMASCKSMLTAQIDAGVMLNDRVSKLNRFVKDNSTANKFITFFHAEINAEAGALQYVNAGHNPPIVLSGSAEPVLLKSTGPVLGMLDLPYRTAGVGFPPGAVLVAFSDGVCEAANSEDEEYGEERLVQLLRGCTGLKPEEMRDAILADVERFAGGFPHHDDVTLVIVRRDD